MSIPIFFPRTLDEASQLLDDYDGNAKVVAGATALTLMMKQKLVEPEALVSIGSIAGLRAVDEERDVLRIGALVSHADAARHPCVRAAAPVVAQAFSLVGNVQVRAAATVGGVMAEADYASDPPAAMVLLDSSVVVTGVGGTRQIAAEDLFVGFYQTSLDETEIIREVVVPIVPPGAGTVYLKFSSRSEEDRPCVGVAALARQGADGAFVDVRVSVGAAAEIPLRLKDVEALALGTSLDDHTIEMIAQAYADRIDPVSDVRGSAWYRTEMTRVWVARAIRVAMERSTAPGSAR